MSMNSTADKNVLSKKMTVFKPTYRETRKFSQVLSLLPTRKFCMVTIYSILFSCLSEQNEPFLEEYKNTVEFILLEYKNTKHHCYFKFIVNPLRNKVVTYLFKKMNQESVGLTQKKTKKSTQW